MNTVGTYFTLRYSCQYSNTVQDKGTSIPPSTERLSSAPSPLQHQPSPRIVPYLILSRHWTETSSGKPFGSSCWAWGGRRGGDGREGDGREGCVRWDWTGWKGRTRDKMRGEAGKVYIPPRYIRIRYTLYAVRYTLSDR